MITSTHSIARYLIVFLLGSGVGYVFAENTLSQPTPQTMVVHHEQTKGASTTSPVVTGQTKTFTLLVKDRKLVSGPSEPSVTVGDTVTIAITVNEDEELHLHGYNKMVDLQKDKQGMLTFVADTSGRFPFELEHSSTELGALDVLPK